MLQKIIKSTALLALIFIVKAGAQSSPSPITIDPTIRIIQPITIEKVPDKDLHFGKFAAYMSTEGTIILSPAGERTPSEGIELLGGSTVGAAQFIVRGLEASPFSLDLPLSTTVVNQTYGTDEMTVTNFTTDLSGFTIGTGGSTTFNVGATLNKGSNDRRGTYVGSFSLTVNYE